MLQLNNKTPFAAEFALFPNDQGIDTLYTMVKASFAIGSQWTLLDKQFPLNKTDKYWADPASSSLKCVSDFHTGKASTDIHLYGSACSPNEQPVRTLDVGIQLGNLKKIARVFGDRYWDNDRISTPEPFTRLPLVHERAFGGVHKVNGQLVSAELRNPVGTGFFDQKHPAEVHSTKLPNIENPQQLIQHYLDKPEPVGFAPVAPHWHPRVGYAGTYDPIWQQERAPYLPADYNRKFMNSAHPDLIYPDFLKGGEPVSIVGMHPKGTLSFTLPQVRLTNKIMVGNKSFVVPFVMETLVLDPTQLSLSMVWRAAFECDKKTLNIKQVLISLA